MDNIIQFRQKLKPEEQTIDFAEVFKMFNEGVANGTVDKDKWFFMSVSPEGHLQCAFSGFSTHEINFCLDLLKGWLMSLHVE